MSKNKNKKAYWQSRFAKTKDMNTQILRYHNSTLTECANTIPRPMKISKHILNSKGNNLQRKIKDFNSFPYTAFISFLHWYLSISIIIIIQWTYRRRKVSLIWRMSFEYVALYNVKIPRILFITNTRL